MTNRKTRKARKAKSWNDLVQHRYAHFAEITPSRSIRSTFPLVRPLDGPKSTVADTVPRVAFMTVPSTINSKRIEFQAESAHLDEIDYAVKLCIEGHSRQLDLEYFHGAGTGSVIADDIGVTASVHGIDLGHPDYRVRFTAASWAEGIWFLLTNARVDIYEDDGVTLVESDVTAVGVSNPTCNEVFFYKKDSTARVRPGYRFVLKGAREASIYGVRALLTNKSKLFNIAEDTGFWRGRTYDCQGKAFDVTKLLEVCATLQPPSGADLTAFFHPLQFQDIVADRDALRKVVGDLEIGPDTVRFDLASGRVEIKRSPEQKQGQAYIISCDNAVSVGECQLQLVGADGSAAVVSAVPGTKSFEVTTVSCCAPFLRRPASNLLVQNILPSGATQPV